jgi:monoamine oxidase
MIAFAVEWLTKLFGSDATSAIKLTSTTRWNAAPYVLGAISAAQPGGEPSRKLLTEPVGNLFLAGEATHETLWGTVDGAWESGERAADAALRRIAGVKEAVPAPPPRSAAKMHRRIVPRRSASPYH